MEPSFVTILPGIRLSTLENMESGEKIIKIGPLVQKIGNFLVESIVASKFPIFLTNGPILMIFSHGVTPCFQGC